MTTQAPALTTTFTPDKSCFQYYKYRYTGDELTCLEGGTGAPTWNSARRFITLLVYVPADMKSHAVRRSAARRERRVVQVHLVVRQSQAGLVSESVVGGDWKRTTVSGAAANAIGIPIRWHSSDFASTTTGARTSATGSATETISSSTSESSSESSSDNGGLSTGAKAGIGAGVGVVALVGLAALGWFILRARRAKQASIAAAAREEEAKGPQMQPQLHPWELDSHEAMISAELPSDSQPLSSAVAIVGTRPPNGIGGDWAL
ncbi:uncharacterized protein FTJAE_14020 [Fusarium tjaetaba]|uniref:Mid2 domain-containing protein n=1 Tax=Fusarium tjaetaba TaxID=1567544 RepID=A0A8H5V6E1_9HYPO|nr:uncharacterized protein FTJAE_14020 [Fusarium tjaetaba]KAF5612767.1 hypothetical protein FTJAE_14020 [Fusarium tjaetaba]